MTPWRGPGVNLAPGFSQGKQESLGPPVKQAPHAAHAPRGSLVAHDRSPMEDPERFTKDAHDA